MDCKAYHKSKEGNQEFWNAPVNKDINPDEFINSRKVVEVTSAMNKIFPMQKKPPGSSFKKT
jgi:hypothetical protein